MNPTTQQRGGAAGSGFTLVELIVSLAVLTILARVLMAATETTSSMTALGNVESQAQRDAQRALSAILDDLRSTGEVTVGGLDYPYVFDGGAPDAAYNAHAFAPAPQAAAAGDADFGVLRTIVLAVPSDLDGDGRPELDADRDGVPELDGNGDGVVSDDLADIGAWDPLRAEIDMSTGLVWSTEMIAYRLVTGPSGENQLVRVVDGGAGGSRTLATGVERIQFDTAISSGFEIPIGSIRVRIFFRISDAEGHVYRSSNEALVRLRNS